MPTTNPTIAYHAPASQPSTVPPESRCAVVSHHASDIRMEQNYRQCFQSISQRELAVVELAYRDNREIAVLLGISKNTVKVHMRNACQKLGADNRTAAYALVMRRGPEMARADVDGFARRSA